MVNAYDDGEDDGNNGAAILMGELLTTFLSAFTLTAVQCNFAVLCVFSSNKSEIRELII